MRRPSAFHLGARALLLLVALVVITAVPLAAIAQEEGGDGATQGDTESDASAEQLLEGADLFSANCQSCHQAGGVGLGDTYPPLVDNPRTTDPAYVIETVKNGKQGPIEVNGVTYDGVMPAFATLSDGELEALAAYVAGGFQLPAGAGSSDEEALPVATGSLPDLSNLAIITAFVIAAAATLFVLAPHIISVTDRVNLPWLDGWLRAGIIFVALTLAVAVIPSMVMKMELVGDLPRAFQDIIGLVLWGGGLGVGLLALWWFQREKRI